MKTLNEIIRERREEFYATLQPEREYANGDDGFFSARARAEDFLESSLRSLAAEFEKLVPENYLRPETPGLTHDELMESQGIEWCREQILKAWREFIG